MPAILNDIVDDIFPGKSSIQKCLSSIDIRDICGSVEKANVSYG